MEGVYAETARGAYLTSLKTKDLARFYAANPKENWLLMEFISPSTTLKDREGKTLKEHGIHMLDDAYGNRINGIRVDYGNMEIKAQ